MKHVIILATLVVMSFIPTLAQNKKLDKSLAKIDFNIASGSYAKAKAALEKLGPQITSPTAQNTSYLPGYYLRQVKINLALGLLNGFDDLVAKTIQTSKDVFGENSKNYANMLIDMAELYLQYGNYRIATEYTQKARTALNKSSLLDEAYENRLALVESETLIARGFSNKALEVMLNCEKYFLGRAVEKTARVENGTIVNERTPEIELPSRFGDYARLLTNIGLAYSKKGNLISADSAFKAAQTWIRKNQRFLGETSYALVTNNYHYATMLVENGNVSREPELEFSNILTKLKAIGPPTTDLAHKVYLTYMKELLNQGNNARYQNTKIEYQKLLQKYFSRTSIVMVNMNAVEFDAKLSNDKTKNLESTALATVNSPVLPANHKTKEIIYKFLYQIAIANRNYANAEKYLLSLTKSKIDLYGEDSPEYHLQQIELAGFYLDYTNKIDEAKKIYQTSYEQVIKKEIGLWHKDHLDILNHLATFYELTDQFKPASTTLEKALSVARSKYDNRDPEYGIELTRISELQIRVGQLEAADKNINEAVKVLSEFEKDDARIGDYVHALETQAKLFGIKGMFQEAEDKLRESAKLISKADVMMGDELKSAEELTSLFISLGRYTEADELLAKQIPAYEKLYGTNSLRLIEPLVNKGRSLLAWGDYTEADRIAQRAYRTAIEIYGEKSTKTAVTQKLLSEIYFSLGDYDRAKTEISKAMESQLREFGRNHIEYAKSLAQLAIIRFNNNENLKEVENQLDEAKEIILIKLGNQSPQYADIQKNIAMIKIASGRADLAFSSLTVAESIWQSKTGKKNNINAATIYTLTGDAYYLLKNYKKAAESYQQSKTILSGFFTASHPDNVRIISKLAKVAYMQKEYKVARKYIEEALENYEGYINQFFPALSEREKAKYWNTIKSDFEFYNTLAFSNQADFKDLTSKVYNNQLTTKALLLNSSIKIRQRIMSSTDETLKAMYTTWLKKKETLTLAIAMTPEQLLENNIDLVTLNQEVEKLEKTLSESSEVFKQGFDARKITVEDVRKSLKPNEVAIEMVRYRYFNHTFTDSVIYAALYTRPEFKEPKVIFLGDGKRMEGRGFKYYRNAIISQLQDENSYGMFWKPIAEGIGLASNIFFSAEGIYNQINLEAIPTPDGRYILDNANIILVSNTKDLYLDRVKTKLRNSSNTITMFGNPTFYLASKGDINPLPGTEREVSQLKYMFDSKGWSTVLFVENNATEENIKEVKDMKVVHIATHGFYKPAAPISGGEISSNEAALNQNPLLRTGLLLRGAGDIMNKSDHNFNLENGILTASEAMNLNLDKTDMVVLSACETGLGDLEVGEGVQGLQKAFLVAGAKMLIMSMFKVDDEATQKLMSSFYQKWINTGRARESFVEAKKEVRAQFPEPIYWGAFMMIGMD